MSAGTDSNIALPTAATVFNGLHFLAPKFRAAVESALAECASLGLDAVVYETYRTRALAEAYYARGRTVKPPATPVTNAKDNMHSWHGFGLAADVIHRTKRWDAPAVWWRQMGNVFKAHGCTWGGDWRSFPDLPHVQFGALPSSPDDADRAILLSGGPSAVWLKYGAV